MKYTALLLLIGCGFRIPPGPLCQVGALLATCGQEMEVARWANTYRDWNQAIPEGWTVSVVAMVDGEHAAITYHQEKLIEVESGFLAILPHELEHARLGPDSGRHCGWIADGFAAWEEIHTGIDEMAFLKASCP